MQVEFIQAAQLPKSTREAPWRLDVLANGSAQSYVLQLDSQRLEHEYGVLKTLETTPVPAPRPFGLDLEGKALGVACFFREFIEGEPLLTPVLAGEAWAEDLYIRAVHQLLALTERELGEIAENLPRESAGKVLERAYRSIKPQGLPLADRAYEVLRRTMPEQAPLRFSNGDLWPENFIVRNDELAGVIDFEGARFSDPVWEFLNTFFVSPELKGRGIEARFCRSIGYDSVHLHWYHGLEFFDTWCSLLLSGETFVHHTAESLEANLAEWLEEE